MMTILLIVAVVVLYLMYSKAKKRGQFARTRKDENIIDVEAVVIKEGNHCPACRKTVNDDFNVCPYCGHVLKCKCRGCGRMLDEECKVCPYCKMAVDF